VIVVDLSAQPPRVCPFFRADVRFKSTEATEGPAPAAVVVTRASGGKSYI
jgi:hypothetical protein